MKCTARTCPKWRASTPRNGKSIRTSVQAADSAHTRNAHFGRNPLALFLAISLSACSDSPDTSRPLIEVPSATNDPSVRFTTGTLSERIEAAVGALEASPCRSGVKDRSRCAWSSFPLEPGPARMQKNSGEAILIMDDFSGGAYFPFFRYANRLVGYYRINREGDLVEAHDSAEMPTVMGNVISSFADEAFLPASALKRVGDALKPIERQVWGGSFSHGVTIFSALVDLVPEQPIVLVSGNYPYGRRYAGVSFCDAFASSEARARLGESARRVADGLSAIIARHNVRFVNVSFGDMTRDTLSVFGLDCPGQKPSLDTVREVVAQPRPIYEALFATTGVFAAHAAVPFAGPQDTPYDVVGPAFRNRLKIGVALSNGPHIDALGRGSHDALAAIAVSPQRTDAELFVNHGCRGIDDCGGAALRVGDSLGLGDWVFTFPTTSWIAPLALARFVSLRYERHASEPMTDALIAQIKGEMAPALCGASGNERCIIQDPIRYKQFESYRLGYMK